MEENETSANTFREVPTVNVVELLNQAANADKVETLKELLRKLASWKVKSRSCATLRQLLVRAAVYFILGNKETLARDCSHREITQTTLEELNSRSSGLVKWATSILVLLPKRQTAEKESFDEQEVESMKEMDVEEAVFGTDKKRARESSPKSKVSKPRTTQKPNLFNVREHFVTDQSSTTENLAIKLGSRVKYIKFAENNLSDNMYLIGDWQVDEMQKLHQLRKLGKDDAGVVDYALEQDVEIVREDLEKRSQTVVPAKDYSIVNRYGVGEVSKAWAEHLTEFKKKQAESSWKKFYYKFYEKVFKEDKSLICEPKVRMTHFDPETWTGMEPDYGVMINSETEDEDDAKLIILFEYKPPFGDKTRSITKDGLLAEALHYANSVLKKRLRRFPDEKDKRIFTIYGVVEAGPHKEVFRLEPREGQKSLATIYFTRKLGSEYDLAQFWMSLEEAYVHAKSVAGILKAAIENQAPQNI